MHYTCKQHVECNNSLINVIAKIEPALRIHHAVNTDSSFISIANELIEAIKAAVVLL